MNLRHLDRLAWRAPGKPNVVTSPLFEFMTRVNLFWINPKLFREDIQDLEADGMGRGGVFPKKGLMIQDGLGPLEGHLIIRHDHLILGDVEELGRVASTALIDAGLADLFVSN